MNSKQSSSQIETSLKYIQKYLLIKLTNAVAVLQISDTSKNNAAGAVATASGTIELYKDAIQQLG